MNENRIMELARQLGLPEKQVASKAKAYMGKSDEEILQEMKKIKVLLKQDERTYEKQLQTIKALAAAMNGPQKARLERLIALLES